jgi:hypothetical protein
VTDEVTHTATVEWIVVGTMMSILGGILLLDRAGIVSAAGGWNLWPLLLVGLGINRMFRSPAGSRRQGRVLVFVGGWLLLGSLGLLRFKVFWPLLLVAVGVTMIWKALAERNPPVAKPER